MTFKGNHNQLKSSDKASPVLIRINSSVMTLSDSTGRVRRKIGRHETSRLIVDLTSYYGHFHLMTRDDVNNGVSRAIR